MADITEHFLPIAYINGDGWVPGPRAWVRFTQIFNARPNKYRYAVAEIHDLSQHEFMQYLCWDLYHDDLLKAKQRAALLAPPPLWRGPSADGLVMKAIALYEEP